MTENEKYLEMPWSIEDTIENLKTIKEHFIATVLKTNLDGKGKQDAKEVGFDFSRAIQSLEKAQQFEAIGTIEEFKALKEKKNFLPIATITFSKEQLQEIVAEKVAQIELDIQEIRAKAIDEFAERLKSESYNGYVTLEDYCEDTIESVAVEDIVRIAEQLKAGGKNG